MELCGARLKSGNGTCKNIAGKGTTHPGEGKCKLHGGSSTGAHSIKHGRYAKSAHGRLGKKIREHLNDPNPLDLTSELALLRARIDFLTEQLDDTDTALNAADSFNMLAVIGGIQKLVDTISKVQTREALTANESTYYATRLADILTTEIAYIRKEAISDEDALRYILGKLRNCIEIPRLSSGQALLED